MASRAGHHRCSIAESPRTAPEVRAGGEWSERSDVFSVGLLLFKLLTGKQPFVDDEARARPLREHLPRCPGPLADAVAWALEVDPARRCDAAELAAALDDAAAELEAIEGRAQPASHGPGREAPAPVGTRPTPSTAGRDRWRWRATLVLAALGLVYLGFVLGVVSDLRPDMDHRDFRSVTRTQIRARCVHFSGRTAPAIHAPRHSSKLA